MTSQTTIDDFWALDSEIETATSLLAHGLSIMIKPEWGTAQSAVVLTCLASGVERMAKFSVGLATVADGDDWPAKAIRKYGHEVERLVEDATGHLTRRLPNATGPVYITSLLSDVLADPYLMEIFTALGRWADTNPGRYRTSAPSVE